MSSYNEADEVVQDRSVDRYNSGAEPYKFDGDEAHESEGFSSRWAFWFSIVGCAVGFGNVWRFPYLVYLHGGIAFFIPYILGLFAVIWPATVLELGLGQLSRKNTIGAFATLGPRGASAGLAAFTAFNISTYYHLLLAWCLIYFVNSFKKNLPWRVTDAMDDLCGAYGDPVTCAADTTCAWNIVDDVCRGNAIYKVEEFFSQTNGCNVKSDYLSGWYNFSGPNYAGIIISWIFCYLAIAFGAKVLGYVMYVTMTLPGILLFILVIVGATLTGAKEGVKSYVGKFDGSSLSKGQPWVDATGQGVFSVGVAQGTQACFSCHNEKRQNFVQDAYVLIVGDTFFAFLAGFAVFEVLGYLANNAGVSIENLPISGKGLTFESYPVGLSSLKYPGAQILSVFFFITLWLLGTDTMMGLTESCTGMIYESRLSKRMGWVRWKIMVVFICICALFWGALHATNLGSHLLTSIDNWSCNVVQSSGAGAEAMVAGWFFLSDHYSEIVGKLAFWFHYFSWFIGASVAFILISTSHGYAGLGVLIGVLVVSTIISIFLTKKEDPEGNEMSLTRRAYELCFGNVEVLRRIINEEGCRNTCWRCPVIWSIFVKYVTPTVTCYMFWSTVTNKDAMYRYPANGQPPHPWYIFLIGQIFTFGLFLFTALCIVFPKCGRFMTPEGCENDYFTAWTIPTDNGPVNYRTKEEYDAHRAKQHEALP